MIEITKELLATKFNEFNRDYFHGEIKKTNFRVIKSTRAYGRFCPLDWSIEISTSWVRSERDYWNTLLHEMVHAYVMQKFGRRVQAHGIEWKHIASNITLKTHQKYGIIKRIGGGQDKDRLREDKTAKPAKFAVFTDMDNKLSIVKYANPSYIDAIKRCNVVNNGTIYYISSNDPDLLRYTLRKLGKRTLSWNTLNMSLNDVLSKGKVMETEMFTNLKKVG